MVNYKKLPVAALLAVLAALLLVSWAPFPVYVRAELPTDDEFGPAAALEFYNWNRGELQRPIPFSETEYIKNITNLTEDFWTKDQILEDLSKPENSGFVGGIVIIKTEHCFYNQFRPCAGATAAFEKRSTPLVGEFKLYGRMIPPDNRPRTDLEKKLVEEYDFKQGPGAKIVVLIPNQPPGREVVAESNAQSLKLLQDDFRRNQGYTHGLHNFLTGVIKKWADSQDVWEMKCRVVGDPLKKVDCFVRGARIYEIDPFNHPGGFCKNCFAICSYIKSELDKNPDAKFTYDRKNKLIEVTSPAVGEKIPR